MYLSPPAPGDNPKFSKREAVNKAAMCSFRVPLPLPSRASEARKCISDRTQGTQIGGVALLCPKQTGENRTRRTGSRHAHLREFMPRSISLAFGPLTIFPGGSEFKRGLDRPDWAG